MAASLKMRKIIAIQLYIHTYAWMIEVAASLEWRSKNG